MDTNTAQSTPSPPLPWISLAAEESLKRSPRLLQVNPSSMACLNLSPAMMPHMKMGPGEKLLAGTIRSVGRQDLWEGIMEKRRMEKGGHVA